MSRIKFAADTYQRLLVENDIVMVDCQASWCAACRDFAPVFRSASARHQGVLFASLDTEMETELVEALGISHIPTLLLFREGLLLLKQPGYVDAAQLDDILEQAQALDMELVKADIANENVAGDGPAKAGDSGEEPEQKATAA